MIWGDFMLLVFWVSWLVLFFIIQRRLEFYKLKSCVNHLEMCVLGIAFVKAFLLRGINVVKYLLGIEDMNYYFVSYYGRSGKYIFLDLCINLIFDFAIIMVITCVVYVILDILFISPYRIKYIMMKDISLSDKIQAILLQFIPFYNQEYTDKYEDLDFRVGEVGILITNMEDVNVIKKRAKD